MSAHHAFPVAGRSRRCPYAVMCSCGQHSGWAATRERARYLHAIHVRVEAGQRARIQQELIR